MRGTKYYRLFLENKMVPDHSPSMSYIVDNRPKIDFFTPSDARATSLCRRRRCGSYVRIPGDTLLLTVLYDNPTMQFQQIERRTPYA